MVKWDRQPVYNRITCEMNIYKSLIDISHCERFQVNKDFFLYLFKQEFLDGSNTKCHDDGLNGIYTSISECVLK